jgi:hypothetical protein
MHNKTGFMMTVVTRLFPSAISTKTNITEFEKMSY